MSKKTRELKRSKSAIQSIKAISNPIIFDSASVKSEIIPIKIGQENKTNSRIPKRDGTQSLSTFSIDSDVSSISNDSEIPHDQTKLIGPIVEDLHKSKSTRCRKSTIQKKPKKVSIPEVPKDFSVSKKKPPQVHGNPQQAQKKVEQTISLYNRIKALQNKQNALQQKLTSLKRQSKAFIFIKSKEQKTKKKELNSQLEKVTKARWKAEIDKKFESDKNSKILDFVNKSRDASNSNNKHLEVIDKIVRKNFQQYGYYILDNYHDFLNSRSFMYKSLQEILDRANPIYEDKQILLRYDTYQVKSLLQNGNIKEKKDKRALKEIYKDLKNEISKSRKNFDSKNDQYIRKLREDRSVSPNLIIKSVQTVQHSQHFKY